MDDDDYSSEDIEDFEEDALKDLRSGKVQVQNPGGTLRCPYSPSRKKQAYPYKDLLQHAEGVSKGKRGAEAAGKHRALCKYLKTDLVNLALPPVERVHKLELAAPQRKDTEDLLVYPWAGVVFNIDNSGRGKDGFRVGPGVADIRQYFSVYNPDKTHVFWGPQGHMGMAILTFMKQLEGFKDAQAFEKWFMDRGHGRRDWERRRREGLGSELYGWLARKEDFEGRKETKEDAIVAKYLQENGDLKDVGMVGDEMNKIHDQRFKSLAETVSQKNTEFQNLLTESEVMRRNAEFAMQELEDKHKKELEQVTNKAKQATEDHTKTMHEHNQRLQSSMEALKKRCKDLEDKEKNMNNQAERVLLEQEKNQNRWQLDIVKQQTQMQKKYHTDQVKLIKRHEEERKQLEVFIQNKRLCIAKQHENEVEVLRLGEKIDSDKFKEMAESFNVAGEESKIITKDLEKKLKEMEEQKRVFEEELETLKDENEDFNNTINHLATMARSKSDELEEARKLAVRALHKYGNKELNVKRMGEIETKPWIAACQQLYRNHAEGWEMAQSTKLSEWEELLTDHDFSPFKMVQKGNEDKWESQVDPNNEKLQELRTELGDEVCQTVVTALKELEEYNASGRYPVLVIWNFAKNRKATLAEVIRVLMDALDPKKKKGVKRTVANR
ncbi:unnamed protein product [Calypogeia fissa]